ncbi:MAG: RNA methyltransferase [Pseudomonadota bacterium]
MKKSAYEKRVKKRITAKEHVLFAACSPGLKNLCLQEMLTLGFSNDQLTINSGGIEFMGKPDQSILANLHLRTPLRILMRLEQFKATSFVQLTKKIAAIDWAVHLPTNCDLKLNVTAHKSRLYHSDAIAQRIETIIMDQLNSQDGFVSKQRSCQTLFIRADQDHFTLSLDTTGEPLFKRGIKKKVTQAPLRENIAAAMLIWSHLCEDDILIDPMCGSGTFSLEAAMIKANVPPGFYRSFAFENLPGFSQKTFQHFKKQAQKSIHLIFDKLIFASDVDDRALAALKENIGDHNFTQLIDLQKKDFFSIMPDQVSPDSIRPNSIKPNSIKLTKKGVIILNPPYGKRLDQNSSSQGFYKEIKKKVTSDFKGWRLAVILPSRNDMTQLDLKLNLKPVFHGGMDAFAGIGIL